MTVKTKYRVLGSILLIIGVISWIIGGVYHFNWIALLISGISIGIGFFFVTSPLVASSWMKED